MSGPKDGRYRIQIATGHRPFVGPDLLPGSIEPVIVDGNDRLWNVTKLDDGNYSLIIYHMGRARYSHEIDNAVVVDDSEPVAPEGVWSIRAQDDGTYIIEETLNVNPKGVWTLESLDPRSEVMLRPFSPAKSTMQKWNLIFG